MRRENRPLAPERTDSTRALAFAMVWTLAVVVIATATAAIAWSPAR